jgi:hypothetical protein
VANLQSYDVSSRVVVDEFEDGWDLGVDWANERAAYRNLRLVQQLRSHRCSDLSILVSTLGCTPSDLFGDTKSVSERHVRGFIEGAVAILHEGGM